MSDIIHLSIQKECDTDGLDLRTVAGRDSEVLRQVEQFGGFSVFWATDSPGRACAIERAQDSGIIRRTGGDAYPWCKYEIVQ